jgi:hypothetical protein
MAKKIKINRAPVMTLWAAVVAERLGYDHDTALTLGKAVAGLNAQSKGQRLGIYEKPDEQDKAKEKKQKEKKQKAGKQQVIDIMGRAVPAVRVQGGYRALAKDARIRPENVERYLEGKFGEDLDDAREAMEALAKSMRPEKLAVEAYDMYVKFRPTVPAGEKGWGAKGNLDLGKIRLMAK